MSLLNRNAGSATRRIRTYMDRVRQWAWESHEEGGALVEFALTLPPLLLVVTGVCTFAIAMNQYIELTDATNVGARQLSISRGNTTDPCATVSSAVYAAAPLLTKSNFSFALVINGSSYSGTTCTGAASTLNAAQGASATVSVSYSGCNLTVYGSGPRSCTLQAQTAEMIQ